MKHNNDFRYDLEVGQVYEKLLAEILQSKKIEIKRDFKAVKTGNIFVEYCSRGKPSGLAISEAAYYCYFIKDERMFIIEIEDLKRLCRVYLKTDRDRLGGDSNTSKGILLPIKDLIK